MATAGGSVKRGVDTAECAAGNGRQGRNRGGR